MSTDFDFPGFADDFEPPPEGAYDEVPIDDPGDRKSTRQNSSH